MRAYIGPEEQGQREGKLVTSALEDGDTMFLRNVGIDSAKTQDFSNMTIAVRTSNLITNLLRNIMNTLKRGFTF
jgi:hypothetical protein